VPCRRRKGHRRQGTPGHRLARQPRAKDTDRSQLRLGPLTSYPHLVPSGHGLLPRPSPVGLAVYLATRCVEVLAWVTRSDAEFLVSLPGGSGLLASVDALATIVAPAWPRPHISPRPYVAALVHVAALVPRSRCSAQCAGSVDDLGGAVFDLAVDSEPEVH
jgi:hypothetical protein